MLFILHSALLSLHAPGLIRAPAPLPAPCYQAHYDLTLWSMLRSCLSGVLSSYAAPCPHQASYVPASSPPHASALEAPTCACVVHNRGVATRHYHQAGLPCEVTVRDGDTPDSSKMGQPTSDPAPTSSCAPCPLAVCPEPTPMCKPTVQRDARKCAERCSRLT